ncbi:LuxR C-terminal-related transcriptional regulator [Kitasatospora sp. NPDC051853]|uniref:LuxR C-terminal-related transcriptional regulator n=1 Tax=Kitasatospora sp. NPDC051853 TaxID=3364058 RepID=UPI0037AC20E2
MATVTPTGEAGLLDEEARELYLAVLAEGGRLPVTVVPQGPALARLLETGLVRVDGPGSRYVAQSPRVVGERIGAELCSAAARLLQRVEELPVALDGLTRAYDSVPRQGGESEQAVHVDGLAEIRQRLAELLSECESELLTAQPGPRPPEGLRMAVRQDTALRRRGVRLRTLYQPLVLGEPATVGYAATLSAEGAEIRLLDEPFRRMMIIDRRVAVVPAAEDLTRAVFVSDPVTVSFLAAVHERDWARADAVDWSCRAAESAADLTQDRISGLLAQGLTQRTVASRLGLSERTVAGHISRLRERHGARTLFQLGWRMRPGCGHE